MNGAPPAGLIFDFDGLMVQTEMVILRAWTEVLTPLGATLGESDFAPLIGTHTPGLWESMLRDMLGEDVDLDELSRRAEHLTTDLSLAEPLLPGVGDLLDEACAAGWAVGLGSSSSRAWIDLHLDHRSLLDRFTAVVTRDDVTRTKPAPDIYLEVARRLGVTPGRCVVLEDSEPGSRAAKEAGMVCVAVPHELTKGSDFSIADRVVESLEDVSLTDLTLLLGAETPR